MVLFLASLGVYVLLQNSISLIFGDGTRVLRHSDAGSTVTIIGGSITSVQVIIILATIALWLATGAVLRFTRAGRVLRAVANDLELSRIVGINADWVVTATVMIGSSLAAVAGVLVALDSNATPVMGFKALLGGVVAVIVGGVGNIMGAVFGGLFVGLAQHLGVWKLSTQWQDTIVFLIMIVVLVFRPEGFKRKASGTSRV
jgi:branched-chain amino acid transport system permease protein